MSEERKESESVNPFSEYKNSRVSVEPNGDGFKASVVTEFGKHTIVILAEGETPLAAMDALLPKVSRDVYRYDRDIRPAFDSVLEQIFKK